jgi:hypothetical protein
LVTANAQAVLVTRYIFEGATPFNDIASAGVNADNLTAAGTTPLVAFDSGSSLKPASNVLDLRAGNNALVSPSSDDTTMAGSFSIGFWAKYAVEISAQDDFHAIINKRNDSNPDPIPDNSSNYWMGQGEIGGGGVNNAFRIGFDDSLTGNNVILYEHDQSLFNELEWHHYAMVFDTDNNLARFYLDGTQIGGDIPVANEPVTDTTAQFIIGRRAQGASDFNGWVDDVRLYNHPLTPAEIPGLMAPDVTFSTDFDGMNGVTLDDFHILRNNYLTGTTFAQGDANGNGIVNHEDFFLWRTEFLMGGGSLEGIDLAVPEPSAALLLLCCCFSCAANPRVTTSFARHHIASSK